MRKYSAVLIATVSLAGCSPGTDVPAAERAIVEFHSDLNAANFQKIYDSGDADLKAATTKDTFGKILNAVHSKLGLFKTGKSADWNDNATTGGHFVTINYQAAYQKGSAVENFVYRMDGNRAALVGYHINSDALLLN